MLDTFKRSGTTHLFIALLVGIATIAKGQTFDRPSTPLSAALAGALILCIAGFITNRIEAENPTRCEHLTFLFYTRSLLAITIALIVVMIAKLQWSMYLIIPFIVLWIFTDLSKSVKEKAFETLVTSPAESTEATNRLTTLTVIQTIIFTVTLYFL